MRLFFITLLVGLTAYRVAAAPGFWDDIITSIKNTTQNVADKISEVATDSWNSVADKITEVATDYWNSVTSKAKDWYERAREEFSSIGDKLKELEKKAIESGGEIFQSGIQSAKEFVVDAEVKVKEMVEVMDEKVQEALQDIVDTLIRETSDLQGWGNETLDNLDSEGKRVKGRVIIQEFIDRSEDQMDTCAREASIPIQDLQPYVNATVLEATSLARKILQILDTCSKASDIFACIKDARGVIKDGKNFLATKIVPMRTKIITAAGKGVLKLSTCMATTKVSIEWGKYSIEKQVNNLVRFKLE